MSYDMILFCFVLLWLYHSEFRGDSYDLFTHVVLFRVASLALGPSYDWPNMISLVPMKQSLDTGGRLNKKDGLTRYGDSHVKDKTS